MDKVLVKNLHVQTILGVNPWERGRPQEIVVSIEAETDTRRAAAADDIGACVDYAELVKEVRQLVGRAQRLTAEALAGDIAETCLNRPGVRRVRVRVEKPRAVIGAESVGVEIERPWPADP
jgi:FolB domain-containing protein